MEFYLSQTRGIAAAKAFFRKALKYHPEPHSITLDGHEPSHCALRRMGMNGEFNFQGPDAVKIRSCPYLNNIVEQDHRRVKFGLQPMLGFKSFYSSLWGWLIERLPVRAEGYSLDLDSTVFERYGQQQGALKRDLKRPRLRRRDRLFWTGLRTIWKNWKSALVIVRPETVISWQRKRFKRYWWRLSQSKRPGRPRMRSEIRKLIGNMAAANQLWGAPRIHGELLKLGVEVLDSPSS